MISPSPWAPFIPTLCIISGIAQYLVHNNLSLLLGFQLLIIPMGHATGWDTFFHSLRFQNSSFSEVSGSVLKTFQKKEKTKFKR